MVTISTSLASPEPSTWKIALCSESTGMTEAPDRSSASRNTAPAATTHSLLASATIDAALDRGQAPARSRPRP